VDCPLVRTGQPHILAHPLNWIDGSIIKWIKFLHSLKPAGYPDED